MNFEHTIGDVENFNWKKNSILSSNHTPCYIGTFITLIHMHAYFLCHHCRKPLGSAHRPAGWERSSSTWHPCGLASHINSLGLSFLIWAVGDNSSSYLRIKWDNFDRVPSSMPSTHPVNCNCFGLSIMKLRQLWSSRLGWKSWAIWRLCLPPHFLSFPQWCDPGSPFSGCPSTRSFKMQEAIHILKGSPSLCWKDPH